jgi:hypothetical protein
MGRLNAKKSWMPVAMAKGTGLMSYHRGIAIVRSTTESFCSNQSEMVPLVICKYSQSALGKHIA